MTYEFGEQNNIGKLGEEKVKEFLKGFKGVKDIIDVSNDREYQNKDIDFIMVRINGTKFGFEIKTDTYLSGNMFFEVLSNVDAGTQGCMMKTKADYLFYYFINENGAWNWDNLYVFNVEEFRKWFKEKRVDMVRCGRWKKMYVGNKGYMTMGYTIPLDDVRDKKWCRVWKIRD